jgi:hypothetical protein
MLLLSSLALQGAFAFNTDVDHNNDYLNTVRANSGYSIDDFNSVVDQAIDACDSNGCDVANKICDDVGAHCVAIDGDNIEGDFSNILDTVKTYIKQAMHTEDATIDDCTSSGCGFLPATNYSIPGYISLKRNNDDGSANALYKIDISSEETQDACGAVFDALSAAGGGLDASSALGAIKIAVCQ